MLPLRPALAATLLLLGACSSGRLPASDSGSAPASPPEAPPDAAPWAGAALDASDVPPVLLAEWRAADNRATCAPLAPASLGAYAEAAPRAAVFGGGWGLAYDLPALRSAFGVAGTGVPADAATYDDWPHRRAWPDGSTAGYGPEGGDGPKQLAYLRVAGQGCLYNVWSHLGRDHLEALLESLRFVDVSG